MTHLIKILQPKQTSEDHLLRSLMKEKGWSLKESIVSLESAYPFYDSSDVGALLIKKRILVFGLYYIIKNGISPKILAYKIKAYNPTPRSILQDIHSMLP
jgi:hypothetical protein